MESESGGCGGRSGQGGHVGSAGHRPSSNSQQYSRKKWGAPTDGNEIRWHQLEPHVYCSIFFAGMVNSATGTLLIPQPTMEHHKRKAILSWSLLPAYPLPII